jgi:hypothetical protein
VNKDVQRLREPGAWVLLGSVALQIISGLIGLLFGGDRLPFTFRAYQFVIADQFFTGVAVTGLVVLAVLLTTRLGGPPTRGARNVVLAALILLGVIALVEVIGMLAGLGAGSNDTGILLDNETTAKLTMFLYGIAKLAVLAVGGYYVLTVVQSFAPAGGYPAPYGQGAWGGPGAQPSGPPGYGPPPVYGQAPQQQYPPQNYPHAPYGQQGQQGQQGQPVQAGHPGQVPPQAAPGYGQPPQSGAYGPQSPCLPPVAGRPPSPPPSAPPQPPAPQPSAPQPAVPQPAAQGDDGLEGEWTRAYGTGESEQPEPSDTPESSSSDRSSTSDSYRPPE